MEVNDVGTSLLERIVIHIRNGSSNINQNVIVK